MSNRENLLTCALHLFTARGYDAVGVQEIADAAGIGKPTLYHYFGSKHGLLSALLDEGFAPFFETLHQAAVYHGDLTNTLRAVTAVYFDFAQRHPQLFRFALSLYFAPAESEAFRVSAVLHRRQNQVMETMFSAAAQQHGNMRGRETTYAASFLGLIQTYVTLALNNSLPPGDETIYRLVHQFMHGIFS